jgi:pyridoxamine 5'-phosphate oxidase
VDTWLESLHADPFAALRSWLEEARAAELHEPEAMALATATASGQPSARMVLLRALDERGLCFFTNYESRKAGELAVNPQAAVALNWGPPLRRQVRVEGTVERLTEDESRAYFETRARESRLGAWASPQSHPLTSRDELDERYAAAEARFAGAEVPLPPFWGGYRLVPTAIELWQNRPNRLHDRARYERDGAGWTRARLAP